LTCLELLWLNIMAQDPGKFSIEGETFLYLTFYHYNQWRLSR
jgi:hypothetical protein